jgi:lysophospholipase L1-like esterase
MNGKGPAWGILLAALTASGLIPSLSQGAAPNGPSGQYSKPVVRRDGTIASAYRASDDLIYIKKTAQTGASSEQAIPGLGPSVFCPALSEDPLGRLWVLGEEWSAHESRVVLARLTDAGPVFVRPDGQDGRFDRSPDMAFDAAGAPWIAWASGKSGDERLRLADASTGRSWTIAGGNGLVLAHPRILCDSQGLIWVFWAGAWRGERGVYYSTFDGSGWTEARKAGGRADYPCLDAEPAADGTGRIWLLWSGYDGASYGPDYSVWNGRTWAPTKRMDENPAGMARAPQLTFLNGGVPAAIWQVLTESGRVTMASLHQGGAWTKPVAVAEGAEEGDFLKLAATGDRLAVIGRRGAVPAVSFIEGADLRASAPAFVLPRGRAGGQSFKHPSAFIFNPLFSESRYIGFGDSITYGVMDFEYAPEKGYIPRLQALLTRTFGAATLYNDGFPGELTGQGVVRIDSVIAGRQARYLLLLEGTNDVKFLEVPVDTAVFNLKEMLRKCRDAGVFPAIATLIPRRDWIWYFDLYTDRFFALNAAIPLMASEKGVPLLDLFAIFDTYPGGGADLLISTDGVHPNELGYQLMAEQWMKAIQAYPFPPVQIQVRRTVDKIMFYRRSGNMLSWQSNPNTIDAAVIRGVRVYRRKRGERTSAFRLLSFVTGASSYFDATIESGTAYEYVLTAVRTDGIEGPGSAVVLF